MSESIKLHVRVTLVDFVDITSIQRLTREARAVILFVSIIMRVPFCMVIRVLERWVDLCNVPSFDLYEEVRALMRQCCQCPGEAIQQDGFEGSFTMETDYTIHHLVEASIFVLSTPAQESWLYGGGGHLTWWTAYAACRSQLPDFESNKRRNKFIPSHLSTKFDGRFCNAAFKVSHYRAVVTAPEISRRPQPWELSAAG